MNLTVNYLSGVDRHRFGAQFPKNPLDRIARFMHNHPTAVKVIQIAAIILGAALLVGSAFMGPALGIAMGLAGATMAFLGLSFYKYSHYFTARHDMANHVFEPRKVPGGELRYCNDVPILTLDARTPREAGFVHGLLLAPHFEAVRKKYNVAYHDFAKRPRPDEMPDTIKEVRSHIPLEYQQELEGLADGFNQWAQNDPSIPKLTVEELILFHLMPDSVHFKPIRVKKPAPATPPPVPVSNPACTAIAAKGILARTMDWPTVGEAGTRSLVTVRKKEGQDPIVEVGFAGCIGVVTAMKGNLKLAMNICNGDTEKAEGMPASFLNRKCLEECSTVREVEAFLGKNPSLGPYHITAADEEEACSFHLKQGANGQLLVRACEGQKPLVVTNCRYTSAGGRESHRSRSEQREAVLEEFFADARAKNGDSDLEALIAFGLSLPFVDNWESAHGVVMRKGSLSVSFNNGFAGSTRMRTLTLQDLLG